MNENDWCVAVLVSLQVASIWVTSFHVMCLTQSQLSDSDDSIEIR